jgi:hypothetical protein
MQYWLFLLKTFLTYAATSQVYKQSFDNPVIFSVRWNHLCTYITICWVASYRTKYFSWTDVYDCISVELFFKEFYCWGWGTLTKVEMAINSVATISFETFVIKFIQYEIVEYFNKIVILMQLSISLLLLWMSFIRSLRSFSFSYFCFHSKRSNKAKYSIRLNNI